MFVFLFTDIEGSSKLWEEHTAVMTPVIARHDEILRGEVEAAGGRITKHTGDGITAVFQTTGQPVACALQAQVRFAAEPWGEIGELRIRAGLHAGEAEFHPSAGTAAGDYFGPPVNATARVMSAAWGGQVLLTPEVTQVSPLPPQATLLDLGQHLLKNVSAPQQLYQLDHPQLPWHQFPPPRTLSGHSIRQAVDEHGGQMATLEPTAMGITLVAATLLPVFLGDVDPKAGALEGNLGVLDALGADTLRGFVAGFAERLPAGKLLPAPEIQSLLQRDLQAQWQAGGETAVALRTDAGRLLQAVHGVEAAMGAANAEVKEALARGLADLGSQFGEFRWMLAGVQDTLAEMRARQDLQLDLQREQLDLQRQQVDLQREQLGKLDRILDRQPAPLELEVRLPAFLDGTIEEAPRPAEGGTRFVARERELARMGGFLDGALAGQGRVIFVTAEAGGGKTALLGEFARQAMAAYPDLLVASGDCNALSGAGDPYLPFREVLGMLTGDVEARWSAGSISTEHAGRLWGALPVAAQALVSYGPHVTGTLVNGPALLSRATSAAASGNGAWLKRLRDRVERQRARSNGFEQSSLFEQVTNVLCRLSETYPLLLLLDDIQWIDSASVGLLFHLGRRLEGRRILAACAYRPAELALGGEAGRDSLQKVLGEFKRQSGDVWVDLGQSNGAEGRAFVDALLDTEPNRLGEGFRGHLFARTAGHPLFTRELLRGMQERGELQQDEEGCWIEGPGLRWEELPARVEGVIEQRIEHLDPELRDLLSVASVEGIEFTAQVVAQVQGSKERQVLRHLSEDLERKHRLIRASEEIAVGQELLTRWRFAHVLFRDYLYNGLSAGERRLLHREVGTALEGLYQEQVEEIAARMAVHFAGHPEKERHYARLAGERAAAQYANEEAIDHLSRALELTPEDDLEGRYTLLLTREKIYDLRAERELQGEDLAALQGIARSLADPHKQVRVAVRRSQYEWFRGDHPQAAASAEEALHLLETEPDPELEARARRRLALAFYFLQRPEEAVQQMEKALELARQAGARWLEAEVLRQLGNQYALERRIPQARDCLKASRSIFHEVGDRFDEMRILSSLSILSDQDFQYGQALEEGQAALRISRQVGARSIEATILNNHGAVLGTCGDYEGARASYARALAIVRETGDRGLEVGLLFNLAEVEFAMGGHERVLHYMDQALSMYREMDERIGEAYARLFQAVAYDGLGQHAKADSTLRAAIDQLRELGATPDAMAVISELARVRLAQGDLAGALAHVEEILDHLETCGPEGIPELLMVYLNCYRVLQAAGDLRAGSILDTAYEHLQENAAKIDDERLRRSYLENVTTHREIVEEYEQLRAGS